MRAGLPLMMALAGSLAAGHAAAAPPPEDPGAGRLVAVAGASPGPSPRVAITFGFRPARAGAQPLLRLRVNGHRIVARRGRLSVVADDRGTIARVAVPERRWARARIVLDARRDRIILRATGSRTAVVRTRLRAEEGVVLAPRARAADLVDVVVSSDTRTPGPWAAPNPFDGATLWAEPDDPASRQAAAWRATRPDDAALIERIASQPRAVWVGDWTPDVAAASASLTRAAQRAGRLPVLVAYAIPQRDCGGHSAGGLADASAYAAWIRRLAAGIGPRPAVVVLEPDALAQLPCLPRADARDRMAMLRDAALTLGALPRTAVYVDAGHPAWLPAATVARLLGRAGVREVRGFALNVASSRSDAEVLAYGRAIARRLGGARFVADTSRNGRGPAADGSWCNAPGLGLGRAPGPAADEPGLDAWLWVKRPGESDGTCNGGPPAGRWWPEYALGLAIRAAPAG